MPARLTPEQSRRAAELAVGRRVRALDRDDVGLFTTWMIGAAQPPCGSSASEGVATRRLSWSELLPIDTHASVESTAEAEAWLHGSAERVTAMEITWTNELGRSGVASGEGSRLVDAVQLRERRLASALFARSPEWLPRWLGERPSDAAGATTYDDAVSRIAAWRDRRDIADSTPGLGATPADHDSADRWRDEMEAALRARCWLAERSTVPASAFASIAT